MHVAGVPVLARTRRGCSVGKGQTRGEWLLYGDDASDPLHMRRRQTLPPETVKTKPSKSVQRLQQSTATIVSFFFISFFFIAKCHLTTHHVYVQPKLVSIVSPRSGFCMTKPGFDWSTTTRGPAINDSHHRPRVNHGEIERTRHDFHGSPDYLFCRFRTAVHSSVVVHTLMTSYVFWMDPSITWDR